MSETFVERICVWQRCGQQRPYGLGGSGTVPYVQVHRYIHTYIHTYKTYGPGPPVQTLLSYIQHTCGCFSPTVSLTQSFPDSCNVRSVIYCMSNSTSSRLLGQAKTDGSSRVASTLIKVTTQNFPRFCRNHEIPVRIVRNSTQQRGSPSAGLRFAKRLCYVCNKTANGVPRDVVHGLYRRDFTVGFLSGFAVPAFVQLHFACKESSATTHKCPAALAMYRSLVPNCRLLER